MKNDLSFREKFNKSKEKCNLDNLDLHHEILKLTGKYDNIMAISLENKKIRQELQEIKQYLLDSFECKKLDVDAKEVVYIDIDILECIVFYKEKKYRIEPVQDDFIIMMGIISELINGFAGKKIYIDTKGIGLPLAATFHEQGIAVFPITMIDYNYS